MATFYNQATLTYSGGVVNSNITSGEIVEVLAVTKTAVRDNYTGGSEITYAISITNSGAVPYTGLELSDDLGGYSFETYTLYPLDYISGTVKYFINGILQPAPQVTAGPPLVISGITVPAGANVLVLYTASITEYAPFEQGSSIENTVMLSDGAAALITATNAVSVLDTPVLRIVKSVSPAVIAENDRLTYTFVIENTGNTDAVESDNAVVTDTFDPILTDIAVTYNSVSWAQGAEYSYDEVTGVFETAAGAITVPAASYAQDPASGSRMAQPGITVITVTGTV